MIGPINAVDVFIICIVSLSLIFGLIKGFLREIFSFIFLIMAIILASLFYTDISSLFVKNDINSENILIQKKIDKKENNKTKSKQLDRINTKNKNSTSELTKRVFEKKTKGRTVADFIAFLIIFFFILVIGSIVTYFIKKILVRGPMKSVDRILGAFFGLIRGILICSVIVYGARKIEFKVKTLNNSFIVKILINETIDLIKDFLPDSHSKY